MSRLLSIAISYLSLSPIAHIGYAESPSEPELPPVTVTASALAPFSGNLLDEAALESTRAKYGADTAQYLREIPGVYVNQTGGASSLPSIRGLADDRLRIKINGMDFISSCPNHMNPPLSYTTPDNLEIIEVHAGISPVSVGGDSIGGSIVVKTHTPEFAAPDENWRATSKLGAFYRSNGHQQGAHLETTQANEHFSAHYAGSFAQADNYKAGGNFKMFTETGRPGHTLALDEVGSTAYETTTHALDFALKQANHIWEAQFGLQNIPDQYYPNQRMDMLDNEQHSARLGYEGQFAWGKLETQVYHETVDHYMDFGPDKKFNYTAGNHHQGMPMYTNGKTTGAKIQFEFNLNTQEWLRLGSEYQDYTLNDYWPAVTGSMGMGPYPFINIHDGQRKRAAFYSEWEKQFYHAWTTRLGLRYEQVKSDAGLVHGYNTSDYPMSPMNMGGGGMGGGMGGMDMMNQIRDAAHFNTHNREQTDDNLDLAAQVRYLVNDGYEIELGLARKVRSPNLYERYSWSTAAMMAIMNNTAGDGNGYVGDPDLKPEIAYTLSISSYWYSPNQDWTFKITPFYTQVTDYIDVIALTQNTGFNILQYANHEARLYGVEMTAKLPLGNTDLGRFALSGLLNYTRGENLDRHDDLYNIQPLNARLVFTHQQGTWENALEIEAAQAKNHLSTVRHEVHTPGYTLLHLRTAYTWDKHLRLEMGAENLLDKLYYLPTGGTYTGQGATMGINSIPSGIAVPGSGRSFFIQWQYSF